MYKTHKLPGFRAKRPKQSAPSAVCSGRWQPSCLILALLAWAGGPIEAQDIMARSGKEAAAAVVAKEHESPMVLDLRLPRVLDLGRDQSKKVGDGFREYVCDDVAIYYLGVKRGRTTKAKKGRPAATELTFYGHVWVRESHDRLVTLTFTLKKGDERVHSVSTGRFDAEEEKNTQFEKTFTLPVEVLENLYAGSPQPTLEVVLEVIDD